MIPVGSPPGLKTRGSISWAAGQAQNARKHASFCSTPSTPTSRPPASAHVRVQGGPRGPGPPKSTTISAATVSTASNRRRTGGRPAAGNLHDSTEECARENDRRTGPRPRRRTKATAADGGTMPGTALPAELMLRPRPPTTRRRRRGRVGPAQGRRVYRLLLHLHGPERQAGEGDRRRHRAALATRGRNPRTLKGMTGQTRSCLILHLHRPRLRARRPRVLRHRAALGQRRARGHARPRRLIRRALSRASSTRSSASSSRPSAPRAAGNWTPSGRPRVRCVLGRHTPLPHPLAGHAAAVGPYEGRLRDIIHAFKYDRRRTLARPLAALMRDAGRDVLRGAGRRRTGPAPLAAPPAPRVQPGRAAGGWTRDPGVPRARPIAPHAGPGRPARGRSPRECRGRVQARVALPLASPAAISRPRAVAPQRPCGGTG